MTRNTSSKLFIKLLLDGCYSIFTITNLVVIIWRSIWELQEFYFVESEQYISYWISLVVSYLIILVVKVAQRRFYRQVRKTEKNKYYAFTTTGGDDDVIFDSDDYIDKAVSSSYEDMIGKFELRVYIVLFAFANINHWRGIWNLTSYYTDNSNFGILWIGFVSFVSLCLLKRVNSLMSAPFQINNDCIEVAFKIQAENLHNYDNIGTYIYLPKWQYISNFVHEYITDVCTIQVWRSYWVILDKYLYPNEEDHIYSAIICLASGVFIYIIIYCFKDLLNRHLCKKSHEQEAGFYKKEILLRVIVLINFIAVVNIWRGLWMLQMLMVKTFVSKNSTKSIICLLSICLGLVCLLIFHRISAILSRGNCKDEIFFMEKKYIVVETVSTTFLSKESEKTMFSHLKHRLVNSTIFNYYHNHNCHNQDGQNENGSKTTDATFKILMIPNTSIPATATASNSSSNADQRLLLMSSVSQTTTTSAETTSSSSSNTVISEV